MVRKVGQIERAALTYAHYHVSSSQPVGSCCRGQERRSVLSALEGVPSRRVGVGRRVGRRLKKEGIYTQLKIFREMSKEIEEVLLDL